MKKTLMAILALAMTASLVGCSVASKEGASEAAANEVVEYDEAAAVANVGDETVTFGEYKEMFDTYASYYTMMGYDLTTDEATLTSFQDFIIDTLVEEKVIAFQASQAGFSELSAEKAAEVETTAAEELENLVTSLREQAESEAAEDSTVNVEDRLAELIADESEYFAGSRMTYEELAQWIVDYYTETAVGESFQEDMLKDVAVSDEDVQNWYDTHAASDLENYGAEPANYKADKENEELFDGDPVIYAPAGYSRIYELSIYPEADVPEDYATKQSEMDALKSEYGELAFTVNVEGGEGASRLKEIVAEYRQLKADAEKIQDDYFASTAAKANEAYAKLQAGEDFTAVMAEYAPDAANPDAGLLISSKYVSEGDWSNEIKSAFAALKVGEFSGVIRDDDGCHIIYYLGDEPEGNTDIEAVRESIRELLLTEAKNLEWTELIDIWKNDGSVTLNDELIHSLTYGG